MKSGHKGNPLSALIVVIIVWLIGVALLVSIFVWGIEHVIDYWRSTEATPPVPTVLVTPVGMDELPLAPTPTVAMFAPITFQRTPAPFGLPCEPWGHLSDKGCQPSCEPYYGCMVKMRNAR